MTADVLIIGGGVIGLSVAFSLLRSAPGTRVIIADAGAIGGGDRGQASYAAAGMLAPFAEAHAAGPFVALGVESLNRYPDFIAAVRDIAGPDGDPQLDIVGPGMLRVARNPDDAGHLETLFHWQRDLGFGIESLTGEEARSLEPDLAADVQFALFSPRERQVDPRRLTRTLAAACLRLGVVALEMAPVTLIESQSGGYRVVAGDQTISCNTIVVSGGAWSREIGCLLHVSLPIHPVRGQILALQPNPTHISALRHSIYESSVYLVPRPEGRVVVGATEEPDAGFDARVIDTDVAELRRRAGQVAPSLADAPLDGPAWAGLRPASADDLPVLGPLPGRGNVHVATGHFRNGILLTPVTGEIIAHGILHGTAEHPLLASEFRADRFTHP